MDETITDHVEAAVRDYIQTCEKERGEPFEVLKPHRVGES